MGEVKRTVSEVNEMRRKQALELISESGLEKFLQVAGTKYAVDTDVDGVIAPVRVDIVAVKDTGEFEEFTAVAMNRAFLEEQEQKKINQEEKAKAKAKKIKKDTETRAKAKADKENIKE